MEENFGILTDLGIRFQEAVLLTCDEAQINPNFLPESVWNNLYEELTEESFEGLVKKAVDTASEFRDIVAAFDDYHGF